MNPLSAVRGRNVPSSARLSGAGADALRFRGSEPDRVTLSANRTPEKSTRWKVPAYILLTLGLLGSTACTTTSQSMRGPDTSITREMTLQQRVESLESKIRSLQAQMDAMTDQAVVVPLQEVLPVLVGRVAPSHVTIRTFYKDGMSGGSGMWIELNGKLYILTNHHVIEKAHDENSGFTASVRLYNGSDFDRSQSVSARLVRLPDGKQAVSKKQDLALLEVTNPNFRLPANVSPVRLRDLSAEPLRPGELAIGVGSPFFLPDAVTFGVVSHSERRMGNDGNIYIQVDHQVNPGMSGGAFYDLQGRLIGVTRSKIKDSENIGFIIRNDSVLEVLAGWNLWPDA